MTNLAIEADFYTVRLFADQVDAFAQCQYGCLLFGGGAVPMNKSRAAPYFKFSINHGIAAA
jgi:hypothetical protein